MALNLGNTAIQKIYLGATEIKNIYLGANLIYQSDVIQPIIDAFKTRVSADGGTFEAEQCLRDLLTTLNEIE